MISKNKIASFDVDAQRGFTPLCPNELPVPDGHTIVDELNKNAECGSFRIGSKDAHGANAVWIAPNLDKIATPIPSTVNDSPNVDCYWPRHCEVGTDGFELLDGLPHPMDYDFFVYKGAEKDVHPYGACYHDIYETMSTGAIEMLKLRNIEVVIVGGLALEYCVLNTIEQLLGAGFIVILNLSSTRAITEAGYYQTIAYLESEDFNILIAKNAIEIQNIIANLK